MIWKNGARIAPGLRDKKIKNEKISVLPECLAATLY